MGMYYTLLGWGFIDNVEERLKRDAYIDLLGKLVSIYCYYLGWIFQQDNVPCHTIIICIVQHVH